MMSSLNRFKPLLLPSIIMAFTGCGGGTTTKEPFPHQDNVFKAVDNWYINPIWSKQALEEGGQAIAGHSTAVWLDQVSDIETIPQGAIPDIPLVEDGASPKGGFGLREHLEEAETQGNALLQLVIYNAPGRDCSSYTTTTELPASEYGMSVYREHYIDRITNILADYPHIPVVAIIEPLSSFDLVFDSFNDPCQNVSNLHDYGNTNAVRYAINELSKLDNVHIYVDIASSQRMAWTPYMEMAALFMHGVISGFESVKPLGEQTAQKIEDMDGSMGVFGDIGGMFDMPPPHPLGGTEAPGYDAIDGFVTNIADYIPLDEPYLGDPQEFFGDNPLSSNYFYDWNPWFDELSYSRDWLSALTDLGVNTSGLGIVIDTSRNGWGQAQLRLQGTDVIVQDPGQVLEYRLDQREYRGNWCNQEGGIGKRPQAQPYDKEWIDAYAWVKEPGLSDGSPKRPSTWLNRKPWKPMCAPDKLSYEAQKFQRLEDLDLETGALPNSPRLGEWFPEGFKVLLKNAWPPLCEGKGDDC